MAKSTLTKYTLDKDEEKSRWDLTNDKTNKIVKTFATKAAALKGGAIKRALGKEGGSVKVQKKVADFRRSAPILAAGIPNARKGKESGPPITRAYAQW